MLIDRDQLRHLSGNPEPQGPPKVTPTLRKLWDMLTLMPGFDAKGADICYSKVEERLTSDLPTRRGALGWVRRFRDTHKNVLALFSEGVLESNENRERHIEEILKDANTVIKRGVDIQYMNHGRCPYCDFPPQVLQRHFADCPWGRLTMNLNILQEKDKQAQREFEPSGDVEAPSMKEFSKVYQFFGK